ncbi:MAG: GIY-YIG nuclease family protein [Parcubacteria group bacterium]|nr:GIY-YIG nuclease family protein [Parcubacteria group bacterium]
MNIFVYILKNNDGKIYIGQTHNIEKRLLDHNDIGFGYTSKFRPWKLIHSEEHLTRKDAMARERYLKTGVGRDWIKNNMTRG